jgi:DMSO reductase anchor subunit
LPVGLGEHTDERRERMNGGVIAAIGALILVQVTLQVIAIVQLVRTPAERVSLGGRKWLWAVIILLGELIGPILWFVLGKTPEPVAPVAPSTAADDRDAAVDALYGPGQE